MKLRILAGESSIGLTLIELVVAMAILALGAISGLIILVQAHKANGFSRAKTMAINAAEQQMETVFNAQPPSVAMFNNQTFVVDGGNLVSPVVRPDGTRNAGLITVTGDNLLSTVTVRVDWQGQGRLQPGHVTLTALRSTAER